MFMSIFKFMLKINDFDVVLLDLDGTIYYGNQIIERANILSTSFEAIIRKYILQRIIRHRRDN